MSLRLSAALREPVAFGVNVTLIEQLAPATNVDGASGHVVVSAKSPAFAPVIFGLLTLIGVPLGLPMVTVSGLLLRPTFSVPKFSALGKIPMTGRLSMMKPSRGSVGNRQIGTAVAIQVGCGKERWEQPHWITDGRLERAIAVPEKK